jgi:hypothetical protein
MSKLGVGGLIAYLTSRLRFPQLFWLTAGLFVLDLFVPDMIPAIDEIMLGLLTVLLGSLEKRSEPVGTKRPPMKNVTPSDP